MSRKGECRYMSNEVQESCLAPMCINSNERGEEVVSKYTPSGLIELRYWIPTDDEIYFTVEKDCVIGRFDKFLGINHEGHSRFYIKKSHFIKKIHPIVHHLNYYLNFYDTDKELLNAIASIKYLIDKHTKMSIKSFKALILDRIITDQMIERTKAMADDLYCVNINSDNDGKYTSTPKITNAQAKRIVAVTFAIKFIFPLCIHFSNINIHMTTKTSYIPCFNKIFKSIIDRFEECDEKIYIPICEFIEYRIDRSYKADREIWMQKKQLYGITKESYLQELIHEIIIVKGLYKLKYWMSVVSFIDGIVHNSYINFKKENFPSKPVELSAEDTTSDSDDYLNKAEAMEMASYRIDASNLYLNEINNRNVMRQLTKKFGVGITDEELQFYADRTTLNLMNQFLIHSFFTKYFKNPDSVNALSDESRNKLFVYLKRYLQLKDMPIIAQVVTADVKGKFKENSIKNGKFIEKITTSDVWKQIIEEKFKYIKEINTKEDILIKKLSTIINSSFIIIDENTELNGQSMDSIGLDQIIDEFLKFLVII